MEAQTAAVAGTVVVVMVAAAAAAVQGLAEEVEKVVVVQGWAAVVGTAAAATAAAAAAGVGWAAAAGLDWMRGSPPFLQLLPGALARPSGGRAEAVRRVFFPPSIHASPDAGVVSSRELAVHNVGLNGYEGRGAPIGSRAGRAGLVDVCVYVPTGTLTR